MEPKLITTCAVLHTPGPDPDQDGRMCVGHCPACHEAVWDDDQDGPVWTCPANLSSDNPHHEPSEITHDMQERAGVFSSCGEDFGLPCYEMMPLHGQCYDGEELSW